MYPSEPTTTFADPTTAPTPLTVNLAATRTLRPPKPSPRTAAVGLSFGIPHDVGPINVVPPTRLPLAPGKIIFLTGPSGSGKSSALDAIADQCPAACRVDRISFRSESAVIDLIAPAAGLSAAARILTACGLSEPRLWLRRFDELSDGEQFRVQLAAALAAQRHGAAAAPILCDEFCTALHPRLARALSYNLARLLRARGLCAVLAGCHDYVTTDLHPDVVIRLAAPNRCTVEHRPVPPRPRFSLRRRMEIVLAGKRDYDTFAPMHYRRTDELGFVDRVFVLRERARHTPLGVVVYAFAPLELALRNRATDGYFLRRPDRLNRDLRILRRLVIHPDLRGCGLGHALVRQTMPRLGTPYVECLAALGAFNPIFEKAGMTRVGACALPPARAAALNQLLHLGVDPLARDFLALACRRRDVREIVAAAVRAWYAATTGGGDKRVAQQSPYTLARTFRGLIAARPVYYLWKRRKTPAHPAGSNPTGVNADRTPAT